MARNVLREQRPLAAMLHGESPEYRDALVIKLELSSVLSPRPVLLSGHDVTGLELDLRGYGFTGELTVLVSDDVALLSEDKDDLLTLFRAPDLIKVHLTVQAYHLDEDINTLPVPLELDGMVTERALSEHVAKLGNAPLSFRRYIIRFADAAQVLWRQHFPCELFTNKSLRQVIDVYRTTHLTIEYPDLDVGKVVPMIFLGCDAEHRGSERASFYDLLMWRLDEMDKIWVYDYTRKVYQVQGRKPLPVPFDLIPHDIDRIATYYPEYPRYQKNVLNDFVEATQNRLIDNLKKVVTLRQDHLFNTMITSDFNAEVQKRTTAFRLPRPEFVMHYHAFPSKPYTPNVGIDFRTDALDLAAEDLAIPTEAKLEVCRVYRLHIRGERTDIDIRPVYDGLVPATFKLYTSLWLELGSDTELRLPPYILPRYPVAIEGRVVSEYGSPQEETYQFYPELLSRIPRYKVMIPLWANQIITTPYYPNTLPGQFYFPLYKYERVLVNMFFDKAMICEFREWRATAQLPQDTQGDQLLLGKTPINRTSVRHTYEDLKPVFEIERLNQFDNELVKIAEGNLLLQVGTPPLGLSTGTVQGRKLVLPAGLPAVPPRGSPPLPGLLPPGGSPLSPGSTPSPLSPPPPTPPTTPPTTVGPGTPASPNGRP